MLPINVYPYLNLNDLNLDFILKTIGELRYEVTNFVSLNAIKYADPIQWDITSQYEKNTIVIDPVTGTAYISVAPVPAGVALTRTEYWTVVFDLGSFVTKAAKNFTSRYEESTTLTATFSSNTGDWLVWGDVLYKALTNITAGDTYVVGGNIDHFTIEDIYIAYLNTIANILAIVGDLADLTTSDTTSIVNAINSVKSELGDITTLTTTDKTNVVNAINELNDLRPYLSSLWTQIWIDSINGDDDNDGLTNTAPLKSVAGLVAKYIDPKRDKGGYISSFRINFMNADTFDIAHFQGVSNVQLHFYNESAGTVTLQAGNSWQLRNYNTYMHFNGTSSAPLIFDVNGDYTFGGDNNAYWFDYTTIINSGASISGLFQNAKGCEFTFQNSVIDKVNMTCLFRDSNIWCNNTDIRALTQLIGGSIVFFGGNTTNSMQLNECDCEIFTSHTVSLDLTDRNYAFSIHGAKFTINQPCTVNVNVLNSTALTNIPFFNGTGNTITIPYAVTFAVGSISTNFTSFIYGSDNVRNIDTPTNILSFCNAIYADIYSKENIDRNVYGAFNKNYYGSPQTLADLNGVHFDKYFTGHFLSLNIQGNNYILDLTNSSNRLNGVAQVGSMGQFAYFYLNITLTNTPSGGCTINVGSSSRIFNFDVTAGTCTSTTDLSSLNLFEVNMF